MKKEYIIKEIEKNLKFEFYKRDHKHYKGGEEVLKKKQSKLCHKNEKIMEYITESEDLIYKETSYLKNIYEHINAGTL